MPPLVERAHHRVQALGMLLRKVIEFEDPTLDRFQARLAQRLGFRPVKQSLRIEACCEELRSTGRCPNLIQARLERKRLPGKKR